MSEQVYGRHAVLHLLQAGRRAVHEVFLLHGGEQPDDPIVAAAERRKIKVSKQERSFFTKFDFSHQGVIAETSPYPYSQLDELAASRWLLILDGLQDPQNLGAICRSALLIGVEGVVIPENRACPVTGAVCKAAAGAVEYLKIAQVSSIAQAVNYLKKHQFWIYGADSEGGRPPFEEQFPEKVVLVVGGEGRGLGRLVRERCDLILTLPMARTEISSYNASAATAMVLAEILRQKICRAPKTP